MTVAVKKADADKVFAAVKKKYKAYLDGGGDAPLLVKDWDWTGGPPIPYAIVWEGGPYEWAIGFTSDDVDEELAILGAEFGIEFGPAPVPVLPDTVFTEPVTGWALGVYPA